MPRVEILARLEKLIQPLIRLIFLSIMESMLLLLTCADSMTPNHSLLMSAYGKCFLGIDFFKNPLHCNRIYKGTEGIMREFDRGYSEITFSKIAVVVKASEAIIHKEYHLSSADPVIVGVENRPAGRIYKLQCCRSAGRCRNGSHSPESIKTT